MGTDNVTVEGRLFAVLFAILLCGAPVLAPAQNWPGTQPIKFEVGATAGALNDFVPRELSNYLSGSLAVPVVVENRPGAGGNIAAGFVAKAQPDGHSLLVTGSQQVVNPTLLPNPGFDYERDLAPVAMVATASMVLVASPGFPAKTITDVLAIARQKPKAVSIAVPNIGTPNYLATEMLAQYGNVDLTIVPYDGIPPAIPDLMANRVDLTVGAMSTMLPLIRNGALNALAVLSPQRSPLAPDIPTSAEAGLPTMQIQGWICIMTTGGTPAPIVARLDAEIAKTTALAEVRAAFARQGVEIFYMNSVQLGRFLQSEAARFSSLLAHANAVKMTR